MTTGSRTKADPLADATAEQKRFLEAFAAGAERFVIEARLIRVRRRYGAPAVYAGFFRLPDDTGKLWEAIRPHVPDDSAEPADNCYLTVNPVNPDLYARAAAKLKPAEKGGTLSCSDKDITARRWLVIDIDPTRPVGVSASDAEKVAAKAVAGAVRDDLSARGWPAPMVIDSGNGLHLYYRFDLPADDGGLVERCLKALAARHDTAAATVDTSCFNASRIMKLPGTFARKGDSIPERPHRLARVLEVPGP